jgi:hypothetical protein
MRQRQRDRIGPHELAVVKAEVDCRLHDLKVRGQIEIARGEEAMVANVQDLAPAVVARNSLLLEMALDPWQDRVAHALESLGYQGGANGARGLARPKRNHPPPPADGYERCGQEETRKIDDVAHVIPVADALDHEAHDLALLACRQPDRPANACVETRVF